MSIDHIPDDFGHWFAGFVDGEGCFYAGSHEQKHKKYHKYYKSMTMLFVLQQRADDLPLLERIRDTLKCGGINSGRGRTGNQMPTYRYTVGKQSDLRKIIIPLFDKFPLRSKKDRDYKCWAHIVRAFDKQRGRVITPQEWARYQRATEALKAVRAYDYDPILAAEIEAQHTPTPQWEQQGLFQ